MQEPQSIFSNMTAHYALNTLTNMTQNIDLKADLQYDAGASVT